MVSRRSVANYSEARILTTISGRTDWLSHVCSTLTSKKAWLHSTYEYPLELNSNLLAAALIKVSILVFYLRILGRSQARIFHFVVYLTLAYVISYSIAFIFATSFTCKPAEALWLQNHLVWSAQHNYTCRSYATITQISSILNLSSDLWITVLPMFVLHRLQMSKREKWGLRILFGLGFA